MVRIQVHTFQPFETRRGKDTVLALRFAYNTTVITVLKTAFHEARRQLRIDNPGGWLPEFKCWFVERPAWPLVRGYLKGAGCVLEGDPLARPKGDPTTLRLLAGAVREGRFDQASAWVLSDYLEEQGDARAVRVREVAEARTVAAELLAVFV